MVAEMQNCAFPKTATSKIMRPMHTLTENKAMQEHLFTTAQLCQISGIEVSRATRWTQECILRPNGAEHNGARQFRFLDVYVGCLCETMRRRGIGSRVVFRAIADRIYTCRVTSELPFLTLSWDTARGGLDVSIRSREAAQALIDGGTNTITVNLLATAAQLAADITKQMAEWEALSN